MAKIKKKYTIPIYENGIKTKHIIEFDHGSEKYNKMLELTGEIPVIFNINTKK